MENNQNLCPSPVYLGVMFQPSNNKFSNHIDRRLRAAIFLGFYPSIKRQLKHNFDLAVSHVASYMGLKPPEYI
jgi:hypothetical protein